MRSVPFTSFRSSRLSPSIGRSGHLLPALERSRWTRESPSVLSRFVEEVRVITERTDRFYWLPDGRTALVFRVLEGGREGDVAVLGPRTRALFKTPRGVARVVLVQFKPGWSASLLGATASALTDRVVPLEDLWGLAGGDLAGELLEARSLPEVIDRVARAIALRSGRSRESSSARLARRAARLLEEGAVRVEGVAEQLGVTARHLRRAFTESIGIGPKDFARGVRLRRAVRMAATSQDWGSIAAGAGYYDQSHLIADFRDLVGLTPGAFLKRA
ncbi:MAG: AraC family transcriptional regulator [Labilithrix sp.]|nr:AraC family transcriptional regulator [Labilithrix sp.]MCW5812854.1 AraC family transcriptional regulator [Labilithrix sp.]